MNIEAMVSKAKARRAAHGLVSTYEGAQGSFEMHHPTLAHRDYYDFRYSLKRLYPTEADVPPCELRTLNELYEAMRSAR